MKTLLLAFFFATSICTFAAPAPHEPEPRKITEAEIRSLDYTFDLPILTAPFKVYDIDIDNENDPDKESKFNKLREHNLKAEAYLETTFKECQLDREAAHKLSKAAIGRILSQKFNIPAGTHLTKDSQTIIIDYLVENLRDDAKMKIFYDEVALVLKAHARAKALPASVKTKPVLKRPAPDAPEAEWEAYIMKLRSAVWSFDSEAEERKFGDRAAGYTKKKEIEAKQAILLNKLLAEFGSDSMFIAYFFSFTANEHLAEKFGLELDDNPEPEVAEKVIAYLQETLFGVDTAAEVFYRDLIERARYPYAIVRRTQIKTAKEFMPEVCKHYPLSKLDSIRAELLTVESHAKQKLFDPKIVERMDPCPFTTYEEARASYNAIYKELTAEFFPKLSATEAADVKYKINIMIFSRYDRDGSGHIDDEEMKDAIINRIGVLRYNRISRIVLAEIFKMVRDSMLPDPK